MNRSLLEHIQSHVAITPMKINMSVWLTTLDENSPGVDAEWSLYDVVRHADDADETINDCGTAGCIAGIACMLRADQVRSMLHNASGFTSFAWAAAELLELGETQATELFHIEHWPRPIALVYRANHRLGTLLAIDFLLDASTSRFGDLDNEPGDYDWLGLMAWCQQRVTHWKDEGVE